MAGAGMVPVERAELFTQDMELISGALRAQYVEHSPGFHCPDLSLVDGVVRSATVGGLHAGLVRYGGFVFSAMTDPAQWPVAMGDDGEFTTLGVPWPGPATCAGSAWRTPTVTCAPPTRPTRP